MLNLPTLAFRNAQEFEKYWMSQTGSSWREWFKGINKTVIIIDEIQMIYNLKDEEGRLHEFWRGLKAAANNPNVHVVCFGAYEDAPTSNARLDGTPIAFDYYLGCEDICYSKDEFSELIKRKNSLAKNIKIHDRVANAIYGMTRDHPGLVNTALTSINNKYYSTAPASIHGRREQPHTRDVINYITTGPFVTDIRSTRTVRSLKDITNKTYYYWDGYL